MSKSIAMAGLTLGVCFTLLAAAQDTDRSGDQSRPPIVLTAMDYIEIEQLVARYSRALDSCSNNGYDYADLFTPDGVFVPAINGEALTRVQGREALAEASGGGANGCDNVPWIQQGIRHLYPNHVITPTADGATGVVDMLMIGLGGDPNKIEYDGYYEDVYVKTADGWRFQSRTHHALLMAGERVAPAPGAAAPAPPDTSR